MKCWTFTDFYYYFIIYFLFKLYLLFIKTSKENAKRFIINSLNQFLLSKAIPKKCQFLEGALRKFDVRKILGGKWINCLFTSKEANASVSEDLSLP
jgi:hypothetical protein